MPPWLRVVGIAAWSGMNSSTMSVMSAIPFRGRAADGRSRIIFNGLSVGGATCENNSRHGAPTLGEAIADEGQLLRSSALRHDKDHTWTSPGFHRSGLRRKVGPPQALVEQFGKLNAGLATGRGRRKCRWPIDIQRIEGGVEVGTCARTFVVEGHDGENRDVCQARHVRCATESRASQVP